ncbi:4'-phosphopantetheinyl transferase family protein [Promicromonospora iranensis]|uniref:4'-phosphopantetheinyl transferase EntD n=1 Tax=Promicromonospora iranensis TaxID=1105144 RepID=A0ABU2CUA8_9MICO|nr:4'-phosphopantetheinyl transferase superfamily protein [Promicromonospora iranensis]MDR7384920.1 4'-phosphopantetheinyl transferase EntD [Promicromonospora iranensis]
MVELSDPAGLVRRAVGPGPAVRTLWGTATPSSPLTPPEARVIAAAVPSRRREFAAGRACARAALEELGHHDWPLLPGPRREPLWPDGVVGSISHCPGLAVAVAARSADTLAIGIDVETDAPLPADVVGSVMDAGEADAIERLAVQDAVTPWGRLLFSAKESVYKAWYPLRHEWLGFEEAGIELSTNGTFLARIRRADTAPLPRAVSGRWARGNGVVVTALVLPAARAAGASTG